MTVPINTPSAVPRPTRRHCTVPTNGADICTFCRTYVPPARTPELSDHFDAAVQRIASVRSDLNTLFPDESAPLFAVVDVLAALVVAIDKATDAIEADHKAVAR